MNNSIRKNRPLLFMTTAAFALSSFDRHILNITLNDIGVEFQLSDLQLGSLSGLAFAVIYALLGFPIAKLTRPGRRKTILVLAISIWSVMTMLMGLTTNYLQVFLARVGVGTGEAGCVPPAHSMITDAYPKEHRASALAFFSAGTNIGIFLSFMVGGFIATNFGWRMAFIAAGIPGLLLVVIVLLGLNDPERAEADISTSKSDYKSLFAILFKETGNRHVLIGAGLTAIIGYGAITWLAAFFVRIHGLSLTEIGIYLAFVVGILGAFGTWLGGFMADWLGKDRPDWRLKFISVSILIAKPLSILFYFSDNLTFALILFTVPAAVGAMFAGPAFAHIYSSIEPDKRPMAAAFMMFVINLVGLGIGPLLVGVISDLLSPSQGPESLRYALAAIQLVGLWAAIHFWLAGQAVKKQQLKF